MPLSPAPAGVRPLAPPPSYFPPAASRIVTLEPQDCRWPIGDVTGDTFAFCSAPRVLRGSYCARHKALSCEGCA